MFTNQRTVLHIDDDPNFTRIVAARLNKLGYEVHSVTDPRDAMREIKKGQYRVVLLDIDMPYLSGLHLLSEIKRYDGGIQIIMLTGLVNMVTVLDSLRCGAEACIFKPIDEIEPLSEALESVFQKIDRWWFSLRDLKQRRKSEEAATPIAVATE